MADYIGGTVGANEPNRPFSFTRPWAATSCATSFAIELLNIHPISSAFGRIHTLNGSF